MGWRRKRKATGSASGDEVPPTERTLPAPVTPPDQRQRRELPDGTIEETCPLMGYSLVMPGTPRRRGIDLTDSPARESLHGRRRWGR